MKYKTLWMPQVEAFLKSLAPEPRREFRQAIKKLAAGKPSGLDIRTLEGTLQGYLRMRVLTYRLIYCIRSTTHGPEMVFVAAGPRSTVYEAFEKILAEQIQS